MLCWMYCEGEGGPTDLAEARRLYGLAAEQGNAMAQRALGHMHWHGARLVVGRKTLQSSFQMVRFRLSVCGALKGPKHR